MQPDQDKVKEFYDKQYYADIKASGQPLRHHKALAKKLGIEHNQNVLDVACGTGEFLHAAYDCGAIISGIDLSNKAIAFCKQKHPKGDFYCQSADQLPFPDNYFDLVTCLGSLEHFPNKPLALKEMVRVTKPSGCLTILVPNSHFIGYITSLYSGTNQTQAIETPLSIKEWSALFSTAGIKIEKQWKDLHFLNRKWCFQNGWIKVIPRGLAAIFIAMLPQSLQYQIYFQGKIQS